MKFIRFGDLKAFEQKMYKKSPAPDEYKHCPPRRRGFFAFPYGFFDRSYIINHPACEPNSPMMYVRDKSGKKITKANFADFWDVYDRYDEETDNDIKSVILPDRIVFRELRLPKQPIVWERRPSWVCVMKDPRHPPRRQAKGGRLNQKFEYLTDENGDRVAAHEFFCRRWTQEDFDDDCIYRPCRPRDISEDAHYIFDILDDKYFGYPEKSVRAVLQYLGRRGIVYKNLFAWPVYELGHDFWLSVFKKPHVFEYDGCIWHHLRRYVSPGDVLAAYGHLWVYTTVRVFDKALKKAYPPAYRKHKELRDVTSASLFGGPSCYNASVDVDGMYEAFFDEEDMKNIT